MSHGAPLLSPPTRRSPSATHETSELFEQLAAAHAPRRSREQVVEQIVLLYLDLCTTMAGRYDGRGVEHDDLVQVARLALVKAVRRYEPGHAPSFAAYAVPTISGELKRWFRDRGWVVRPPRRLQELRADLQAVARRAGAGARRHAHRRRAGRGRRGDHRARSARPSPPPPASARCRSTAAPPTTSGPGLAAFLACRTTTLEAADDRVCLAEALTELDDEERELLLMRYVEGMTQREIGEARGVSQMQVSRTLRRITVRLHDQLNAQVGEPLDDGSTDQGREAAEEAPQLSTAS